MLFCDEISHSLFFMKFRVRHPRTHENKGVIPAQAGIQDNIKEMDSCFRTNDKNGPSYFQGELNPNNSFFSFKLVLYLTRFKS